mgnify:FL=1
MHPDGCISIDTSECEGGEYDGHRCVELAARDGRRLVRGFLLAKDARGIARDLIAGARWCEAAERTMRAGAREIAKVARAMQIKAILAARLKAKAKAEAERRHKKKVARGQRGK